MGLLYYFLTEENISCGFASLEKYPLGVAIVKKVVLIKSLKTHTHKR